MKTLLLATHETPTFKNTIASLERGGITPHVLGFNQKWQGWKWRLEQYRNYCVALSKDYPNELVVILDAFDVLCLRKDTFRRFESAFSSFEADIVFSSEWWCGSAKNCGVTLRFTDPTQCEVPRENKVTIKNMKNKNINVGFVCGKAYALASMYTSVLAQASGQDDFDDQRAIAAWIDSEVGRELKLSLDRSGVLCKTVHVFDTSSPDTQISSPFFAHFPGPMLKMGLFPHYNFNAQTILKMSSHKVLDLSPILFISLSLLIIIFIMSAPPK